MTNVTSQPRVTMKPMQPKFLVLIGVVWCYLALFGPKFFMFFRGALEARLKVGAWKLELS